LRGVIAAGVTALTNLSAKGIGVLQRFARALPCALVEFEAATTWLIERQCAEPRAVGHVMSKTAKPRGSSRGSTPISASSGSSFVRGSHCDAIVIAPGAQLPASRGDPRLPQRPPKRDLGKQRTPPVKPVISIAENWMDSAGVETTLPFDGGAVVSRPNATRRDQSLHASQPPDHSDHTNELHANVIHAQPSRLAATVALPGIADASCCAG